MSLPTVALSINQPWAWLIASGLKDVENRNWKTDFRGEFLIHAGLKMDHDCHGSLCGGHHPVTGDTWCGQHGNPYPLGGLVGIAEVVDCVSESDSPWFVGRYGFVIANARPIEFIPCVGALSFFRPDFGRQYAPKPERKRKAAGFGVAGAYPTEPRVTNGSELDRHFAAERSQQTVPHCDLTQPVRA